MSSHNGFDENGKEPFDYHAKGYILFPRALADHATLKGDLELLGAWLDLVQLANHNERTVAKHGGQYEVTAPRGAVCYGRDRLRERWGWTRHRLDKFLKLLESEGWIKRVGGKGKWSSYILIVHYDELQRSTKSPPRKEGSNGSESTKSDENRLSPDENRLSPSTKSDHVKQGVNANSPTKSVDDKEVITSLGRANSDSAKPDAGALGWPEPVRDSDGLTAADRLSRKPSGRDSYSPLERRAMFIDNAAKRRGVGPNHRGEFILYQLATDGFDRDGILSWLQEQGYHP